MHSGEKTSACHSKIEGLACGMIFARSANLQDDDIITLNRKQDAVAPAFSRAK
jgi:hypothetical protein